MSTFITTSIPYVNGTPHIGHALEFVQADTFARYFRLLGQDTRLLTGTDDNSLSNVHQRPLELVEEQNYFFRLSGYVAQLRELIDSGRLRVVPETRRNEVRAFIARGLDDVSISRSRSRARG